MDVQTTDIPGKSAMVTTQSQTSHNNSVKVFFF